MVFSFYFDRFELRLALADSGLVGQLEFRFIDVGDACVVDVGVYCVYYDSGLHENGRGGGITLLLVDELGRALRKVELFSHPS